MKHTYLLIAAFPSSLAPYEGTWSHPIKIFDCTTSYVLNSGITEPNLNKFLQIYSDDYQLLFGNQNCDLPMRFRTTACQMGNDRQISAELQHNVHFLPLFNSKTTGPCNFHHILHDAELLV